MSFEHLETQITALGEHVILRAKAASAGTQEVRDSGLIMPALEQGKLPDRCEVWSIGSHVPEGFVQKGDITPVPHGNMAYVEHPAVALGLAKPKEVENKFITVHYRAISCIYRG